MNNMEEYFEEVKSRLKRFKLKGKKAQGYGAERYNSWKSKKTDHTRDYGKRSQIPKLGEKEVTRKFNNIENMQEEEKNLLKVEKTYQFYLKNGKLLKK